MTDYDRKIWNTENDSKFLQIQVAKIIENYRRMHFSLSSSHSCYRRDRASLNYSISIVLVWRKMLTSFMYRLIWAGSSEFGSYHLCEQQMFGRSCASPEFSCSLKQAMSQEEPSDRKPDPWPLWMTGHEQLTFFMTRNARRHKFAWRSPYSCASVNNNKKCAIGRSENERKSVLWGKMFIFVVAYMNMINDVGNLT